MVKKKLRGGDVAIVQIGSSHQSRPVRLTGGSLMIRLEFARGGEHGKKPIGRAARLVGVTEKGEHTWRVGGKRDEDRGGMSRLHTQVTKSTPRGERGIKESLHNSYQPS